jgi:hypothetical protein
VFESLSLYICPFAIRDVYVIFGFCHDREVNRRGFLSALIAAGTAAAIDPEKLLWEPGRKLISIPKPGPPEKWVTAGEAIAHRAALLRTGDIFTVAGVYARNFATGEVTQHLQHFFVGPQNVAYPRAEFGILPALRRMSPWEPLGPEDFQAAALAARGSSHRGIE